MSSYGGLSPEVERRLQTGSHVMQEHDRELLLDEVRRDEMAREAGARQRHREQQAQDRADAIMTTERMERFHEAYQAAFDKATREGRALPTKRARTAYIPEPMRKACPVSFRACQATSPVDPEGDRTEEAVSVIKDELLRRGADPAYVAGLTVDKALEVARRIAQR